MRAFVQKERLGENLLDAQSKSISDKTFHKNKVANLPEPVRRLDKGDFSYAKFNITEVEYNKPEKF